MDKAIIFFCHGSQRSYYMTWIFQSHHLSTLQPHPLVESLTLKIMICAFVSEPSHGFFSIIHPTCTSSCSFISCFVSHLRYNFWKSSLTFHGLNLLSCVPKLLWVSPLQLPLYLSISLCVFSHISSEIPKRSLLFL